VQEAVSFIEKNEALRDLVLQLSGVPSGHFEVRCEQSGERRSVWLSTLSFVLICSEHQTTDFQFKHGSGGISGTLLLRLGKGYVW
jgi:hypothetical protein